MKVAWTRRSTIRLEQILEYIAKDQPDNAIHFVERLIEHRESLALQYKLGRMVPE